MVNANSKSIETTTTVTTSNGTLVEFGPVSPVIKALAEAKAAKAAEDAKHREARKAVNGAQQQAREVLGQGISDLAKLCRRFVAAQGPDAAEKTTALVAALHAVVLKASRG